MEFNFDISDFKNWLLSKIPFNPSQKKDLYYQTYLPANFSKRWRTNMNDPISMWRAERTGETEAYVADARYTEEWIRYFVKFVGEKADPYCSYHWIEIYDAIRIVEQWQKAKIQAFPDHPESKKGFSPVRRHNATNEVQKFFVSIPDKKYSRVAFDAVTFGSMFHEVIEHITDRSPYYPYPAESEGFESLKSALLDKLPHHKTDFAVYLARDDYWSNSECKLWAKNKYYQSMKSGNNLPIPVQIFKRDKEEGDFYTSPLYIRLALYHWLSDDSTINFAIIHD